MNSLRALFLAGVLLAAAANAQDDSAFAAPAAIDVATLNSDAFALVNSTDCDPSVTSTIYTLYSRNTMVFQTCVAEGKFRIFPFSGAYPTTQQIGDMGRSLACRAIFLAALLAGVPECNISGFPLRAAAETELKIAVDMDQFPNSPNIVPSTERFVAMMHWRRDVNLATKAGLPADAKSQLYSEFSGNLYTITTNGLIRLTSDMEIEYRSTTDGSFSQNEIVAVPEMPHIRGSGSVASANVGDSASASNSNDTVTTTAPVHLEQKMPTAATGTTSSAARLTSWSALQFAFVVLVVALSTAV